jgi:hypothetical protein
LAVTVRTSEFLNFTPKKMCFEYFKISNWGYIQIIILADFTSQGVLNRDAVVWLDGARLPPEVLVKKIDLKKNLSFVSLKNSSQKLWIF